jgi:hypothetical protein
MLSACLTTRTYTICAFNTHAYIEKHLLVRRHLLTQRTLNICYRYTMRINLAGTRNNGEELTLARRNKYLMGEQVRSSGTRAVQQKMATSWADVEGFFKDWQPDPFKASVTRTPFTTRYTQLQQCCAFREYRAVLSYSIAAISSHIAVVSSLC